MYFSRFKIEIYLVQTSASDNQSGIDFQSVRTEQRILEKFLLSMSNQVENFKTIKKMDKSLHSR